MTKKSVQQCKCLYERKNFMIRNAFYKKKRIFHNLLRAFSCQKLFQTQEWAFKKVIKELL